MVGMYMIVQPYQDRGVQDKERYKIELRKYLELLKSQNGTIPTELAAQHDVEDAKEKLKEAVVDAAIDVAVDVAVNNAVNVSVDDVVDVATKSVTDAPVGNHNFPAASDVAAGDTGKAVTGASDVGDVVDATNGSYNPASAVDVEDGAANTAPVARIGDINLLTTMDADDGIPNAISEQPREAPDEMDADDGIPIAVSEEPSEAPDGSINLLATMDFDIEPQQPEVAPHQPDMFQHPL